MTRTKNIDRNGNVSYTLTEGTEIVGTIRKACSGWYAELPSGNGRTVTSLKKGEELLAFWRKLAA